MNKTKLTKMKNYENIEELAHELGLELEETTTGMNGYPENLELTLSNFDTISELNKLKDELKAEGHDVTVIELHQRDGWGLWERSSIYNAEKGMYARSNEQDWTLILKPGDNLYEVAKIAICCDEEPDEIEVEMIKNFANELKYEQSETEKVTVFYDPDQNYIMDYSVSDEATGYSYDTHNYKLGLLVEIAIEEEDED